MSGAGIASLPMYVTERTAADWRMLWALIAGELAAADVAVPSLIEPPFELMPHWTAPELVLSQTCSKPYRDSLVGRVRILGAFDFGLEGCPAGYYRSAIVVRGGETRTLAALIDGGRVAINGADSQSGAVALQRLGSDLAGVLVTGAHLASIDAVAAGGADVAAIDAQTWRLAQRDHDAAGSLRVLHWTKPTPGLPLICAAGQPVERIAGAVARAVSAMSPGLSARLALRGFVRLPEALYNDPSIF
ncbi:PhnD/SsuA/transferrin family substrate-binding protein [Algicella marina]|uniref:PhnD/SsuA/transferrin family substrate-binding protein n=1 Tax=Algicella marina TaxID=2683284 RepID=A0A6P1T5Z1_9RHOB|nr:PhnD/SsuA/transferrin family substrate-binding protein [Algicella marina]QHQ37123.1 PhnD/SsuA/transferrin family substrate-binding protein [Algicella marina]